MYRWGNQLRLRIVRIVMCLMTILASLALTSRVHATDVPSWLPQYQLDLKLDLSVRRLSGVEKVTFYNRHDRPAAELVFNAYSHYKIPDGDGVKLAKTLELLRSNPSDGIDWIGERLQVQSVFTVDGRGVRRAIPFSWRKDLHTALEVPLPVPIKKNESITVEIHFTLDLPDKEGRWGHRQGITFLTHALPASPITTIRAGSPRRSLPGISHSFRKLESTTSG